MTISNFDLQVFILKLIFFRLLLHATRFERSHTGSHTLTKASQVSD